MKLLLIISINILILSYGHVFAANTLSDFIDKITKWENGYQISIESIDKSLVTVKSNQTLYSGMTVSIFRDGGDILHPITGQVIAKQKIGIATAKINKEYKLVIDLKDNVTVVKTDSIEIPKPIPLALKFDNVSNANHNEIRSALIQTELFDIQDDNKDYIVSCTKGKNNIINCEYLFRDQLILSSNISIETVTIKGVLDNKTLSVDFDDAYQSIAMGSVDDEDGSVIIALATSSILSIYKLGTDFKMEKLQDISDRLDTILNIELVDIDDDNVYELFITNQNGDDNIIASHIYKYDGTKYLRVSSDYRYVFRTFYSNNRKVLIAQDYSAGEFIDDIYYFGLLDGEYTTTKKIPNSLGFNIYGFGLNLYQSPYDFISINKSGELLISDQTQNKLAITSPVFGNNNKYLYYTKDRVTGTKRDTQGNLENIIDSRIVAIPIYQRIIMPQTGRFILLENILSSDDLKGRNIFTRSKLGVFLINQIGSSNFINIDFAQPTVIEVDILNSNDNKSIVVLSNFTTERYSTGSKSRINLYKLAK